ncbi:phosphohistidine phosphatase [Oligella ureolytica]|uniref:Histidine phosphatase family protein n=1 Tax=Oligella ureolytica TaxID=90244 RepID=A0A378XJJ9_9BURK|nr:histidine phosphatase family protein [Oligella ureolytica]QPT40003.1 histidine phosphatase family protein [Oligella ureolytica]SUA58279.1 phosphohistidine phosphatase [Oligella ureolytica]
MKTLLLVRHAKSSWDDPTLSDKVRPLNKRGKRDVIIMGQRLLSRQVEPDRIVASSAVRTTITAQSIAKELGYPQEDILLDDRLYACQSEYLLETVQAFDNDLDYVMLVGHFPELNDFLLMFTSDIEHMPTCAMAELTFDVSNWTEIRQNNLQKVLFDYPKKEV